MPYKMAYYKMFFTKLILVKPCNKKDITKNFTEQDKNMHEYVLRKSNIPLN